MVITRARESTAAPKRPRVSPDRLARTLGWFRVGLGAAEVAAPGAVAALAGLPDGRRTLRAFGLREIESGAGILTRPATAWLWARRTIVGRRRSPRSRSSTRSLR